MYATVQDLRDEGLAASQLSDARADDLLDEASRFVDACTGWVFEPRPWTFVMDGRGTPTIEPPLPPIALSGLTTDGRPLSLAPGNLHVVGAPVGPGFEGPRLTRRHGQVFGRGEGNVVAEGIWGYTESDGTPFGRTPRSIRRATLLLVLRWSAPLGEEDAVAEARDRWRIVEERTRDQHYKLGPIPHGPLTGDPEIDTLLLRFRPPAQLGAAG